MSQQTGQSEKEERNTLPIERGFPIEQVNEIAEKEGRAKQWYRPIYTMHKWWARRLGCVFRAISLYSLVDNPDKVEVFDPGQNTSLSDYDTNKDRVQELIDSVDLNDPESLWELFPKDVRVEDKKVLDPFMGGGTSLVEASRFGAEVVGSDLNPVAWFVTKKQLEAGTIDIGQLESAYETVKQDVSETLTDYYKTECPHGDHLADVVYNFWVKELDCVSCGHTVPLFKDYRIGKERYADESGYNIHCPDCESVVVVEDWRSESTCSECEHSFVPENGTAGGGEYSCTECGQQYRIIDAIDEQNGFDTKLYAVEYYCAHCDDAGMDRGEYRGYKQAEQFDQELFEEAKSEWENNDELSEYVPSESIPLGIKTDSSKFEGSIGGGFNVIRHGYSDWTDMFNERQLFGLSTLLRSIDQIEDAEMKEYLLLAFSEALNYNSMMIVYNPGRNLAANIFKTNAFDPPLKPVENNIWGTEYGTGTFSKMWDMVKRGVEYAQNPTERYIENGDVKETEVFSQPIGENSSVYCRDIRDIEEEGEYDAVITDPPYYDNVIYSELSNFYYVWQKILLEEEYDVFQHESTPRAESIVANPAEGKGVEEFEAEMEEAFEKIHSVLKDDGVLTFTYHHSDSESWGELLTALCDNGFEVTAAYPISADINKSNWRLTDGSAVDFDIIIVARPAKDRHPISWNSLRRNIYRTAQKTRQRLEENRDLSRGDIGVVEMGRCFHEYSKHHGKVERAGETMTAKEVVDEIYGVIQHGSDIGEIDVFLDLLETPDATYDDLNKLTRGTNATSERMEDMRLYRMDDGFKLGTWDDEKRIAYIQSRVDSDEELTDLDKAQFLRYRWEHGKSVSEYLGKWKITDDLRELCEGLADATGDDTYRNILESRLSDF
jgi:adenine-specific DNA methylase